jgi:replication factor C subunit 2/4
MMDTIEFIDDDVIVKPQLVISRDNMKNKIPWVDKYRPKNISEIVNQDHVVNLLKDSLQTGNLPHLLFYGPPGTGKTSTILAFAYQLFGPNIVGSRVMELNASDERGINVVRYKINTFAKIALSNSDPNYPSPPYKLIILDEADAMTTEAQSALRKVMEEYSSVTRFCFVCNYITQIIDPIASRCMKFRFKPIDNHNMMNKLSTIAQNEKLSMDPNALSVIGEIVKGDVRRGIMTLQNLKYINNYKKIITVNDIYNITGYIPTDYIKPLLSICFNEKSTVEHMQKAVAKLRRMGFPVSSILEQIKINIIASNKLNELQKSMIAIQLGMTEKRLLDGSDEYIQLSNVFSYILGVYKNEIKYISACLC